MIAGPVGPLEAVVEEPVVPAGAQPPLGGAEVPAAQAGFGVLCHPHTLHGGALGNNVGHTLARALNDCGMPTLRFNFRGAGRSAGAFDEGRGETDDLLAAIRYGRARWPGRGLWLGGFSFGAYVALRMQSLPEADPSRLIVVAPPLGRWDFALIVPPRCPWLIVQGMRDDLVDGRAVREWSAALPRPPQFAALDEAGHFFHGRLADLREAVRRFALAARPEAA